MKRVLFVSDSLGCHGAARSLANLLANLNLNEWEIDLFLFDTRDSHFQLPDGIRLLPRDDGLEAYWQPVRQSLLELIHLKKWKLLYMRLYNYIFIWNTTKTIRLQLSWKDMLKSIRSIEGEYDLAVSYQDYFTSEFIIEKVRAKRYVTWNHNPVGEMGLDLAVYRDCADRLDRIITVSEHAKECFLKTMGHGFSNKICVFSNPLNIVEIQEASGKEADEVFARDLRFKIVSVGRLTAQKGFDFALSVVQRMTRRVELFSWYIIGEGSERPVLEQMIRDMRLEKHVYLLGAKKNPYPYILGASVYAQPSRFEAECIAVREAQVLHKCIIATQIPAVEGTNAIVLPMQIDAWVETLVRLIQIPAHLSKHCANLSIVSSEREAKRCNDLLEELL